MNPHQPANPPALGPVRRAVAALAFGMTVAGCTSMSGLGGESRYACKAPVGVACDSVSGTYANAIHNNLPSQRLKPSNDVAPSSTPSAPHRQLIAAAPALASTDASARAPAMGALRSQPRILRLWTKPWEDTDGDLYDQGYVYVQIQSGQWLIDHAQRQIRDAYAPVRAPSKATPDASRTDGNGSSDSIEPSDDERTTMPTAGGSHRGLSSARGPRLVPLRPSE